MRDIHLVLALPRVDTADLREEIADVEDLARVHYRVAVLAPCVLLARCSLVRELIIHLDATLSVYLLVFRGNRALEVHLHGLTLFIELDVRDVVPVDS